MLHTGVAERDDRIPHGCNLGLCLPRIMEEVNPEVEGCRVFGSLRQILPQADTEHLVDRFYKDSGLCRKLWGFNSTYPKT